MKKKQSVRDRNKGHKQTVPPKRNTNKNDIKPRLISLKIKETQTKIRHLIKKYLTQIRLQYKNRNCFTDYQWRVVRYTRYRHKQNTCTHYSSNAGFVHTCRRRRSLRHLVKRRAEKHSSVHTEDPTDIKMYIFSYSLINDQKYF